MNSYVEPKQLKRYSVRGLVCRLTYCARRAHESRGTVMNLTWLHWNGEYGAAFMELERRARGALAPVEAIDALERIVSEGERVARQDAAINNSQPKRSDGG